MWSTTRVNNDFIDSPHAYNRPLAPEQHDDGKQPMELASPEHNNHLSPSTQNPPVPARERIQAQALRCMLGSAGAEKATEQNASIIDLQESKFPLPKPNAPIDSSQQFLGHLVLRRRLPERGHSTDALSCYLDTELFAFRNVIFHAKSGVKHSYDWLSLSKRIGKIIWPEYMQGRSGKVTTIGGLFTPVPVFSDATRKKALVELDAALVKGVITAHERDLAIRQLDARIPSQDVGSLLSAGKMKISCYRSFSMQDGVPVIRHHIEAHPVEPNVDGLDSCKIYEGDSDNFARIDVDLQRHIDEHGWLRDPDLEPPSENHASPDNTEESLVCLNFPPYKAGVTSTAEHVRNLVHLIGGAGKLSVSPDTSEDLAKAMRQNVCVLHSVLERFLKSSLPEMFESTFREMRFAELQQCFEDFPTTVSTAAFDHARTAFINAVASLPEPQRMASLHLLDAMQKREMFIHAHMLMRGLSSPSLKKFNDAAKVAASVSVPVNG